MKKCVSGITCVLFFAMIIAVTVIPANAAKKTYTAPTATNVSIGGTPVAGQALTGNYAYYSASGVPQGASTYKWLYSTSPSGTYYAISGATSKTYTLTSYDAGRYFKFQVTPVASWGSPNTGTPVQSVAVGPITLPAYVPPASKIIMGFSVNSSSYTSMVNNTKSIDQIATVSYTTDGYGNISGTAFADQVSYANNNNIKPLALVNNVDSSGFSSSIAKSVLENTANSKAFIGNLVKVIGANGYKGVNIDFENIPYTDRTYYTQFISNIKSALSPLGYPVSISVPAKTWDSPTNSWNGAYDYAALGAVADQIYIMSYDEHGTWTSPGPIASIGWVTSVVNYAKTVIPVNKIILGLAAYGSDWSDAGNKALSLKQIDSLINTYGGQVQLDASTKSAYYSYKDTNGIQHTIWFENSDSIGCKCDLANQNNLLGVGFWRLGLENQAFWNTINAKFGR